MQEDSLGWRSQSQVKLKWGSQKWKNWCQPDIRLLCGVPGWTEHSKNVCYTWRGDKTVYSLSPEARGGILFRVAMQVRRTVQWSVSSKWEIRRPLHIFVRKATQPVACTERLQRFVAPESAGDDLLRWSSLFTKHEKGKQETQEDTFLVGTPHFQWDT